MHMSRLTGESELEKRRGQIVAHLLFASHCLQTITDQNCKAPRLSVCLPSLRPAVSQRVPQACPSPPVSHLPWRHTVIQGG